VGRGGGKFPILDPEFYSALLLQRTMRFKWSVSRRTPKGLQEMTRSLTKKPSIIIPVTAIEKPHRLISTCIEPAKPASIAPAMMPIEPAVDSKQKQCASLRTPVDAERRLRRRMAMSRTKLCASNSADRPSVISQSGKNADTPGHTIQLVAARTAIASTSIHSARVMGGSARFWGCISFARWLGPRFERAPPGRRRQHRRERIVAPPQVMEKRGRHMKRNEAE
jgi:hypothetical protein